MCDVPGQVVVLSPFGSVRDVPLARAAGARFKGPRSECRVAVVDNEILGMTELADHLEPALRRLGVVNVARWSIPHSRDVESELLAGLREQADVVVVGLGNCGACTTWSCALTAELMPTLPTLNVVTHRFVAVARSSLRARGYPTAALAVVADTPELLAPSILEQQAEVVAHAVAEQLLAASA